MERNELERKTTEILVDKLGISSDQIKSEMDLVNELGMDSLDKIYIIMAAEDEFGIELYDNDMEDVKTVKDLCDLIEKKVK